MTAPTDIENSHLAKIEELSYRAYRAEIALENAKADLDYANRKIARLEAFIEEQSKMEAA